MRDAYNPHDLDSMWKLIEDLGGSEREFKPGIYNVIAGYILTFLMAGGGLVIFGFLIHEVLGAGGKLPVTAEKGMSWMVVGLGSLIGGALCVAGGFVFYVTPSTVSNIVHVCPRGLVCADTREIQHFPWDEVAFIVERILHQYFPLHGVGRYLVSVGSSHTYWIHRRDGTTWVFCGTYVKKIKTLGRLLKAAATEHGIEWRTVEETS